MRHVLVETNWVWGYAAPAHHKDLKAVDLLRRAAVGELQMHLPAPCLTEARYSILARCQPRREAGALRSFLARVVVERTLSTEHQRVTREVLDRFEAQIHAELGQVENILSSLVSAAGLQVFPLNQRMLDRAVALSVMDLDLKPFDQAVLAAVLVKAEELREAGEADLCFCELDWDLRPWDKHGDTKHPLASLYDKAAVWVYGDFELQAPQKPEGWPG